MNLLRPFIDHPAEVGETYWQHLRAAVGFGSCMVVSGIACLLHGLCPWLFARTGSTAVRRLHDRMILRMQRDGLDPRHGSQAAR